MDFKATAKYLRISPQKARLVADTVRGRDYLEAVDSLRFMPKKGARLIMKVLDSARANAEDIEDTIDEGDLYIKKIYVDEGPIMYRFRPRARGRATRIRKRLAHITVVLSNEE